MKKKYKAMILSCIDPRFQSKVFNYLKKENLMENIVLLQLLGSAVGVTHTKFKKWHNVFIENLSTSIQLHKINRLIVINHQDCGAAKIVNLNKKLNNNIEKKIHQNSFKKLREF